VALDRFSVTVTKLGIWSATPAKKPNVAQESLPFGAPRHCRELHEQNAQPDPYLQRRRCTFLSRGIKEKAET
jgi:hypothetical protein